MASHLVAMAHACPPAMIRPAWSLADYELTATLYTGYAASVYTVRDTGLQPKGSLRGRRSVGGTQPAAARAAPVTALLSLPATVQQA
jgi:hypothetical protein